MVCCASLGRMRAGQRGWRLGEQQELGNQRKLSKRRGELSLLDLNGLYQIPTNRPYTSKDQENEKGDPRRKSQIGTAPIKYRLKFKRIRLTLRERNEKSAGKSTSGAVVFIGSNLK